MERINIVIASCLILVFFCFCSGQSGNCRNQSSNDTTSARSNIPIEPGTIKFNGIIKSMEKSDETYSLMISVSDIIAIGPSAPLIAAPGEILLEIRESDLLKNEESAGIKIETENSYEFWVKALLPGKNSKSEYNWRLLSINKKEE